MTIRIDLSDSQDALYFDNDIPEGVSVSHPPVIIRKMFGVEPEHINIAVNFAEIISTGLLVNWLYDKLVKCKSNKITINKKTINFDKGRITQIVEESITRKN
ncbi:MAG: hypothetical protein L6300_06965 [Syntrophaceae bacterium]|nr:hypothetical protein [Syntrophaceae bacterium]